MMLAIISVIPPVFRRCPLIQIAVKEPVYNWKLIASSDINLTIFRATRTNI